MNESSSIDPGAPVRVSNPDIDPQLVSENAVTVIESLHEAGFDAYLVGGCVRDLLLGVHPKDFDVATSATPEEVKTVFQRVRLVGRRFRIAHVRFRREIIEVSTFRRHYDDDETEGVRSEEGVVLADNVYGTMDEDAFRRDFTVNALYYDPTTHELMDYVGGLDDLERRTVRLIGDPKARFREDPVRILRALRIATKIGFDLHPDTADAIGPMSELLTAIPPARLFDEYSKLFMSGHAAATWALMEQYELPVILFPLPEQGAAIVTAALESTDERVASDKPVTPGFLLAAMLWPEYRERCAESATLGNQGDARVHAAQDVIAEQQLTIAIPRRYSMFVRDVWNLQARLERRSPRSVHRTLEHARFRAAYDFLMLRVKVGEVDAELGEWWTSIQDVDRSEQKDLVDGLQGGKRKRRRRRSKRPTGDLDTVAEQS